MYSELYLLNELVVQQQQQQINQNQIVSIFLYIYTRKAKS